MHAPCSNGAAMKRAKNPPTPLAASTSFPDASATALIAFTTSRVASLSEIARYRRFRDHEGPRRERKVSANQSALGIVSANNNGLLK